MKIRLLANVGAPTPEKAKLEASGAIKPHEVTIFEGIISDYRFAPDVIVVNNTDVYKYAYAQRINDETVHLYRKGTAHLILVVNGKQVT